MSQSEYEQVQQRVKEQALLDFKSAFKGMIATSEDAYDARCTTKKTRSVIRAFSSDDIKRIVESDDPVAQAKLSQFFFKTNGLYKRIILHYATFLTYSWILTPYVKGYGKYKITDKQNSKSYYDASEFCTNFQIERKCTQFAQKIFVDGAYYGLIIDKENKIVIQDLPFEYCRTRFKNSEDIQIIEFNLDFFKKIRDEKVRKDILSTYPKIVQKAYYKYANNKGPKWFFIPAELGLYFCFFEERPFFLDLIPLLDSLDDYKELDKERTIKALKRILVQEVPHDGMKLVFEPPEAEAMHDGTIGMLANNPDVDVVTSYAKVSLLDMSSADNEKTEVTDMQDLIYSSAGLSKQLFFADTEAGISYSVCNDLALVMILAQSFGHFFSVLLNSKFETKKIKFKLLIVPLSYYNTQEFFSRSRESASFGYSFLAPILPLGLDQTDLPALKALENDLLNLDEILKPLQSSYTQSGKAAGEPMGEVKETDTSVNEEVDTDE